MQELKDFIKDGENSLRIFSEDLSKIRTGRASGGMVDFIDVDAYEGSRMKVRELAHIIVESAKVIRIEPWDKTTKKPISDAIRETLNLNAVEYGEGLKVTLPELSTERRNELEKSVKKMFEELRGILRDRRNKYIKSFEGNSVNTEDQKKDFRKKMDEAFKDIEDKGRKSVDEKIEEIKT